MSNLHGIEVPAHYNGVGLHDTPGSETAAWSYDQAASHARELRAHGVTLYKLFGSGTKGNRARAYRDNGIVVLHRWWPGGAHWGLPPADWLMPRADYDYLLGSGVALFEPGWNEFNIIEEWATTMPGAAGIARAVVDAWEAAGDRYGGFEHLLFPSNTPGGNVDHRACYKAIVAEISNRGLVGTVKHVAIHPRPLNNPPSTMWTATNTCTFDEWRWIRDQFASVGVNAYYWATEHGYSLGDSQNTNYPPINLSRWTSYNWDLFVRMNPAHQAAIEPELAGVTYWFNAGWGHWGPWAKDALVDSPAPEMPAPSPLWIQMGNLAGALAFSRYEGVQPPPPPPERAESLYLSKYQEGATREVLQRLWDGGQRVIGFRVTGPNDPDNPTFTEVDRVFTKLYPVAREIGFLCYGFHYLHPALDNQARDFGRAVAGKTFELGLYGDVEHGGLDGDRCARFFEAADRETGRVVDVYGRKSQLDAWVDSNLGPWQQGRRLWLAAWTYDLAKLPALPETWKSEGFEWWQWTNMAYLPGVDPPDRVCLDAWRGTTDELLEEYGSPNGGNGGDVIEIVDKSGDPVVVDGKTWTWESVQQDYGLSLTEADPPEGATVFRLVRLVYDSSPETNWRLYVWDEDGKPLPGVAAFMGILPDSGTVLPDDAAPRISEDFWGQPEGRPNRALVLQPNDLNFTNLDGYIQHSLGSGSNTVPPRPGGHWAWGMPGGDGYYSDVPAGFGMWDEHKMFWPVFQIVITDDDPEPEPEDDLAEVVEQLTRIADSLEQIAGGGTISISF